MSKPNIDAVKAGAYTALWTFIALFGLALLGWLQDWATALTDSDAIVVADPSVLAKAAVSAALAAATGLVGTVVRLVQANTGLPGGPPSYTDASSRPLSSQR